jgi:PDZ domain-containing secreted protein
VPAGVQRLFYNSLALWQSYAAWSPALTVTHMSDSLGEVPEHEGLTTPVRASMLQRKVRPGVATLCVLGLLLLGVVHGALSTSPYFRAQPGAVIALPGKITGPVVNPSFTKHSHAISYVTVRAVQLNWAQYFWDRYVENSTSLLSLSDLATPGAIAAEKEQMTQAKQSAGVVASYILTGKYKAAPAGASVIAVSPHSPASKAGFEVGDIITGVSGVSTLTAEQLVTATTSSDGRRLRFRVIRSGLTLHLSATPIRTKGLYRIGVNIAQYYTPTVPKGLPSINTAGVAGPSGGLMFTLALIDSLSPGDLTGGHTIAGTGTISAEPTSMGVTGPIGDVALKVQAAIAAHDQVFLVDPFDYAAAKMTAGDSITVVPVYSVYSALVWLCANGATSQVCANLALVQHRLAAKLT